MHSLINILRRKGNISDTVKSYEAFSFDVTFARNKNACTPLISSSKEYKFRLSKLFDNFSSLRTESALIDWIEEILLLLREERNIAHIYSLNDEQKAEAEKYYKTNIYLIELARISETTTSLERKELSESILLSYAELQKRYPDLYETLKRE